MSTLLLQKKKKKIEQFLKSFAISTTCNLRSWYLKANHIWMKKRFSVSTQLRKKSWNQFSIVTSLISRSLCLYKTSKTKVNPIPYCVHSHIFSKILYVLYKWKLYNSYFSKLWCQSYHHHLNSSRLPLNAFFLPRRWKLSTIVKVGIFFFAVLYAICTHIVYKVQKANTWVASPIRWVTEAT